MNTGCVASVQKFLKRIGSELKKVLWPFDAIFASYPEEDFIEMLLSKISL
jgi:hypothetical protein